MQKEEIKPILSPQNKINIYQGCQHGCIYCERKPFEDIVVKENALTLLEEEFIKKRKKVILETGNKTDPYMPKEKDLKLTRGMLELVYRYGNGIHIKTKSSLILRDLDLLKKINKQAKVRVSMTLTTYNEDLCKIIEPNASTTKERIEVLKKLHEEGIETYAWISPILPFINDSLDNLRGILKYCKEASVTGIIYFGLTLKEGNRESYYEMLDKHFPKLKKEYQKKFGHSLECNSIYYKYLIDYLIKFCKEEHILYDKDEIFKRIYTLTEDECFKQISLFDI